MNVRREFGCPAQCTVLPHRPAVNDLCDFTNVDFYIFFLRLIKFWSTKTLLGPRSEPLSTNGENLEQWWTFPRLVGQTKLFWAQWRLIQQVIKEPRTTSKELQASLASIKVSVHDSTIRKRLGKNCIHGRVPRQKPLLTKKNTKARLTFAKKIS